MINSLAILCCYGSLGEHRPDPHAQDTQQYYSQALEFLVARDDISDVVVAGGRTSVSTPISESEEAIALLQTQDIDGLELWNQPTGHSTSENIALAIASMRMQIDSSTKIVIVCDARWYEKVTILTNLLIGDYLDFEVQGIDRVDTHPHASREVQLLEAMPIEIQSDRFKFLCAYIQDILLERINHEMMNLEEDSTDAFV